MIAFLVLALSLDFLLVLLQLLTPNVLIPWLLGMVFGVFVGATPGLTATMAVALIVPVSFYLEPNAGLALIIGVSFTAIFAGDIPATYLRIPGTPASAAATLDGHQMAKQGRGGLALILDLLCSSLGGLIGVALLMLVASPLAQFALLFSNFEYFWLGLLGLSMSALVTQGSTFAGVMSAALGVLISTVGRDILSSVPRYTFGRMELEQGFHFIPVMIGLFGLAEVLRNLRSDASLAMPSVKGKSELPIKEGLFVIVRHKWLVIRSAVVGAIIGALPGAGADIAAWASYGLAQKTSSQPEDFGSGSVEGVIAPTSANNAAVAGAWIPALVFGVPGDAVTAIVLGAMTMYNIIPGPKLFQEGTQVQSIFCIALVTQLLLLPAGLVGIYAFGWMLRLPRRFVLVAVVVFSVVGAFAINNSMFDVYVMLAFGVVGFFLESQRVPLAPLILGLILGPLVERKLRAGLISTSGDLAPMFTRPICVALAVLLIVMLVGGPLVRLLAARRRN